MSIKRHVEIALPIYAKGDFFFFFHFSLITASTSTHVSGKWFAALAPLLSMSIIDHVRSCGLARIEHGKATTLEPDSLTNGMKRRGANQ